MAGGTSFTLRQSDCLESGNPVSESLDMKP
jgi:hypothetical protein